jgi:hypothetical protein
MIIKKKTPLIFIAGVIMTMLSNGCDPKPVQEKYGICPTLNDMVSWENGIVKYGGWQFGYTWIDGNIGVGTGGVQVKNIHSDCGCPYNGSETGGTGNTYAVYLASDGNAAVVFRWKYNSFCELELYDGWKGKTLQSIGMGSAKEDFLRLYHEDFIVSPTDSTQYDAIYPENIHVTAWFKSSGFSGGKLYKMVISGR